MFALSSSRIVSREVLLETSRFNVERVTQQLPEGDRHSREVIRHPGAVVILPILDDGSICLIKNYRIAVDQELYELPAGTLEPGEPPIETAQRELIEETGFRCDSITPLLEFYMSPGILDERMYAFVATGLKAGQTALETGEQIENAIVTQEELRKLLAEGAIKDSKSLSVLLFHGQFSA